MLVHVCVNDIDIWTSYEVYHEHTCFSNSHLRKCALSLHQKCSRVAEYQRKGRKQQTLIEKKMKNHSLLVYIVYLVHERLLLVSLYGPIACDVTSHMT